MAVCALPEMKTFSYLGDTLRLQLTYNRGAFLSFGACLPEVLRHSLFTFAVCVLLLSALVFALSVKPGHFSMVLAVSLFFAGGVGNLIDRLIHNGSVVDFINVGVGPVRTGIFNVADVAIMGGAFVLFWATFHKQRRNH